MTLAIPLVVVTIIIARLTLGRGAVAANDWRDEATEVSLVDQGETQPPLTQAFAAAFAATDSAVRRVGPQAEATRFTPGAIASTPFGSALISEGEVIDPRPHSRGKLAIVYMTPGPLAPRPRSRFVPAVESGSFGRLHDWRLRHDFGPYPVIEVHGQEIARGRRCSWLTLIELRPEAPVELVTLPISYSSTDSSVGLPTDGIHGRIARVGQGEFWVAYSGAANSTDHYVRSGNRFVPQLTSRNSIRSCYV